MCWWSWVCIPVNIVQCRVNTSQVSRMKPCSTPKKCRRFYTFPRAQRFLLFLVLVVLTWYSKHFITIVREDDSELHAFLSQNQEELMKMVDAEERQEEVDQFHLLLSTATVPEESFTPAQNSSYLIEEPDFCKRRQEMRIIAYVHSSISHVQKRQETRKTWGNPMFYPFGKMSIVFFVGKAKNESETKIVEEESKQFRDIIQGDFEDEYSSLTYKAMSALTWINRHCSNVMWTLHADDDILINHYQFWKFLASLKITDLEDQIICHVFGMSPVLREGRYQVPFKQYPFSKYPDYCSGFAWLTLTKSVSRLLQESRNVPFLWVDDAWLTGVVAREAGLKVSKAYNNLFEMKLTDSSQLQKERIFYHVESGNRLAYWEQLLKLS
ncbi:lactosylceramide 1,3-N-acetyl-beta-D-glucosaminyltransferase-like isoform X2 [Oratosquilla oratoria]|uniref:lactosylceramide 1,3-N-acetyl-beta-D-glucosaminyltransferase-like isoform X2 n=1 Tax=Oratosquilla oratoria TaxID=337810 RepID=UPI003F7716F3